MEAREELRKLRESTGMNRKEFCEYFEIPYMTETDWELGNRKMPQYLLRLMAYKIKIEKLADKRNKDEKEDNVSDKWFVDNYATIYCTICGRNAMADNTELMTIDDICNRVYVIRGQQVMLDYDLAVSMAMKSRH